MSYSRTYAAKIRLQKQFELILELRGRVWRRITVEITPDEGGAGSSKVLFDAPSLAPFGLPTPDALAGISMSYQIAQKIHACTTPHDPPVSVNRRPRDVVDLLLIKNLVNEMGGPSNKEIVAAVQDVFSVRAKEAQDLGRPLHSLPVVVRSYPHWEVDFRSAAESASLDMSMEEAVAAINQWLSELGIGIGD